MLRTHALAAGIDPEFAVLDETENDALADAAFEFALEDLAHNASGGVELIAAHRTGLREAILGTYAELRARGELRPSLPPIPPAPDLEPLRDELLDAASAAARELGAIESPAARVQTALERLERCDAVLADADPWPGELDALGLPGGNGAALSTEACEAYAAALGRYREAAATGARSGRTRSSTGCCGPSARRWSGASVPSRASTSRTLSCSPGRCWPGSQSCASATAPGLST